MGHNGKPRDGGVRAKAGLGLKKTELAWIQGVGGQTPHSLNSVLTVRGSGAIESKAPVGHTALEADLERQASQLRWELVIARVCVCM